jgi:argininosuccinate lyase
MRAAADVPTAAATDLAEYLVERGTPFRDAHAIVGSVVRRALAGEGTMADLVAAEPALGADALELLGPGVAVTRRSTPGGAGPVPVAVQFGSVKELLAAQRARLR